MRAHVLSVGSELLLGHLTDTNATFLAQELAALGVELLQVSQLGDDRPRLAAAIRAALADAEAVICTGGVGPTDDDLTREAIADAVGETPAVDPDLLETVRAFFAGRGLTMPERNAKQAWLIPSAEALPNPIGTAPGWFVRAKGRVIIAMPGVPREMFRMWREQALPRLAPYLPRRAIRSTTLKTIGIGESAAEQLLDDLVKLTNPGVATYAKDDGVHVRVTASAESEHDAIALRDATVAEVRRRLRRFIYADDETSLCAAICRLLAGRDLTLGIVERGTAGRIGSLLLSETDTSPVVAGALALPLASGAGATATNLADEARQRFGTSVGLGATVALTPRDDGAPDAMVAIALSGAVAVEETSPFRMPLAETQRRAALTAADVLRRALIAEA